MYNTYYYFIIYKILINYLSSQLIIPIVDSIHEIVSFVLKSYILSKMVKKITMKIKNARRLFRKRKGLTEVVVTLILLAFSVLLVLTASAYTNGVTRARMKSTGQEDVRFYKKHAWVDALNNGTDRAVVAFKLYNLGGKSISVELIDVRGWEVDRSTVYFHTVNKTSESVLLYCDLIFFEWSSMSGSSINIDGYNYTQAKGSIFVKSGSHIVVYIKMPEVLYKDNIGQPITLAVGTTNANYITETVVESTS